jgi:pimeloyl-ACP methyl ester carboxylesterase
MQEFGSQCAAEHLMPTTAFEVQDELANDIAKMNPKTYIDAMQSASLGHFTSSLSRIRVPTLVLVGENDTVAPRSAAEYLAENIAGASLATIVNAAHLSNLDNAADFNAALRGFLDAQSQAA